MIRLARALYIFVAVAFVFIGLLHTQVHFADLASPALEARFDAVGPVLLQETQVRAWDLFQGVSLLMGFFSAALGLTLIAALITAGRGALPHTTLFLPVIAQLIAIAVIGALYLSPFQLIGGIVGALCLAFPLGVRLRQA
ncbi:MAG: hypothetical protein AAF841_00505 [Pseudomonadota bacterium]